MHTFDPITELHHVDWRTAFATYGNSHSTLIGLMSQWWVKLSPETHTVIESGPSNGYAEQGKRGQCDSLFCIDETPVGILEVEGTRLIQTAVKIGSFFDARHPHITQLEFGILVVYAYEPSSRGDDRNFASAINSNLRNTVAEVSRTHTEKRFVLIGLDKAYNRICSGIRSINEYYQGTPSEVYAETWKNGKQISDRLLFTSNAR